MGVEPAVRWGDLLFVESKVPFANSSSRIAEVPEVLWQYLSGWQTPGFGSEEGTSLHTWRNTGQIFQLFEAHTQGVPGECARLR